VVALADFQFEGVTESRETRHPPESCFMIDVLFANEIVTAKD
jgi:hypothetical protein